MIVKGQLEDLLNKFNTRLEHVEKKLDLMDSDRIIFENIQGRLTALEEQWKMTRQHDTETNRDIKAEINSVGDKTIAKVETAISEVQNSIKSRTPSKTRKGFFSKLFKK